MSEELEAEVIETEETETATETADAETPAPEVTEESDAESETALDATDLQSKLEAAEKKIAKMSYQEREARRQQERLISVLENQKAPTPEAKAPQIEDFESLDDYVDARFEYLNKSNEAESEPAPQGVDPAFSQSKDDLFFEGSGKYADFEEKVTSEALQLTPFMANAIFENESMDVQVEIAYSLANNPREAARIAKLSPMRQAAEIGKLELKLSEPKPVKKQPSAAPAPIKPVGGSKTTNNEIGDEEEFESFLKKRNKQLGRT